MQVQSLGGEDSPGGGNGNPLQYSRLENPMDRGAWGGYSLWGCKESDAAEHTHTHKKASRDRSALIYMPCKSTGCQAFHQTLYIIVLLIFLSSGL